MYSRKTVTSMSSGDLKPISRFVQTAKRFESKITVVNNEEHINAKSLRGLLLSSIRPGSRVVIEADGPDEVAAVTALTPFCQ